MGVSHGEAAQYLAAITDGEGTVSGPNVARPELSIANTDSALIDAIEECMNILGIDYWVNTRKPKNPRHSKLTIVHVSKRKALDRFEEVVPLRSPEKLSRLRACNQRPRILDPEDRPLAKIKRLYWDEKLSWAMVAERMGISICVLKDWIKSAGIPSRTKSEARVLFLARKAV